MLTSSPACKSANHVNSFQYGSVGRFLQPPIAMLRCGVAPTDAEDLHPTTDQVLHQALAWRQVHNVELVHLRRDDEQRAAVHLGRCRLILD